MKLLNLENYLQANSYPGRGLLIGRSGDGLDAVTAYFIMGRSENSRNRIFVTEGDDLRTAPFDAAKCADPSLIIYNALRQLGQTTIVTNGDQTDTIYDALSSGKTWEKALRTRKFEPDGPNFTPRISGLTKLDRGSLSYDISILKRSSDGICLRGFYEYEAASVGVGHLIHTYSGDGKPLPSFAGEPVAVALAGDIDSFTETLWNSLNADNRVSLFVRYTRITDPANTCTRIVNKHQQ